MSPPAVGSSVAPHHGTYPSEENTTANHLTAYCEYCHDLFTEHIWFISFVPTGRSIGAIERAIDEHAERYEEALDPGPRRFVRELLEWLDVAPDLDSKNTFNEA